MAFLFPTFGLGGLFYTGLLIVNSVAILSEDRFLARIGMGNSGPAEPAFGASPDGSSVRAKIVNLINSLRTIARIPLIFLNILVIIYLFALG